MAPTKKIPCRFFGQGFCKNGDNCEFFHEKSLGTQNRFRPVISPLPAMETLHINPAAATHLNGVEATSAPICKFFMQGSCNKSDKCRHIHPPVIVSQRPAHSDAVSLHQTPSQQDGSSPQVPPDSRARVPCKFWSSPGGCQNGSCPYLHTADGLEMKNSSSLTFKITEEDDQESVDDFTRVFSGASVFFNEFGHILKVSLPTDFSLACVTGIASGTTPEVVIDILHGLGFNLNVDCVRIHGHTGSQTRVTVKVEDPLFAKELSSRLKNQGSSLSATPIPIDVRRTNSRKVYISWHKATRSVWANFGNGEIANRVAKKFNKGTYKCLGQSVTSSSERKASSRGGGYNYAAWTIVLSNVPSYATSKDVNEAILLPYDQPRHIELGAISYQASDAEVSVEVRSHLEEHGPLEAFYPAPASRGKRIRATALFRDEADARSACSLNNRSLDILGKGKLTVTLVHSAKFKVLAAVYFALKGTIDNESKNWKEQHLEFRAYLDTLQRFFTLKIEGGNAKDVSNARKTLDKILSGAVLMDGGNTVWSSALNGNGSAYKELKLIENELHVVIIRDKSKRQLRFYGPPEKFQHVICQVTDILRKECSTSFDIDLKPHQFSWTIHGGFNIIEQSLGKNVAVFNVVSRRITINGTRQQYETALAIMEGKHAGEIRFLKNGPFKPEGYCPICFCEPDIPIQTSCKHTFCLECFEECCKSAASTSKDVFQIRCHGEEGNCSTIFTLSEVKGHISSSVFEGVLKSFFEEYIQRHPRDFRPCPTPDCGYVYRCTTALTLKLPAYTCPNCFEPLCTSCHAQHGDYTCAEYKDIATGGYKALEKLKRELNIKDCPKCTTPMEKTEGCNHMTCGGCKAHICWMCMAVFETSVPCYDHMNREHGGIGLGLE